MGHDEFVVEDPARLEIREDAGGVNLEARSSRAASVRVAPIALPLRHVAEEGGCERLQYGFGVVVVV